MKRNSDVEHLRRTTSDGKHSMMKKNMLSCTSVAITHFSGTQTFRKQKDLILLITYNVIVRASSVLSMLIRQAWWETELNHWNKKQANNNIEPAASLCYFSHWPFLTPYHLNDKEIQTAKWHMEHTKCWLRRPIEKNKMTQYCESSKLMVKQANKRNNHHFFRFIPCFCWCFWRYVAKVVIKLTHRTHTNIHTYAYSHPYTKKRRTECYIRTFEACVLCNQHKNWIKSH